MPGWAQAFGEIFPLTHFIRVIRAVMLKGADLAAISQEIVVLGIFVAIYALVALSRYRRTLD
jgi:ABC-2 type transport system permease protein